MDRLRRGRRFLPDSDHPYFTNPYRKRGPNRRQSLVIVGVAIFLLLLLADALFVASSLRDRFQALSEQLRRGRAAVEAGDLRAARTSFGDAAATNREVSTLMAHPSYVLARLVPLVALDIHALSALNDAAGSISRAGLIGVRAGEALGGTTSEELAGAFYSEGRVQLEAIDTAQQYLEKVRTALLEARGTLEGAQKPILDTVRVALDQSREDLSEAIDVTDRGDALLSALPALFGGEGPRRYLLAFQTPSQARGTGGVIGLYGVLEADDGRVALTHAGPFIELLTSLDTSGISSVEEAARFRRNYRRAVRQADDINLSPDFPAVARRLLTIYRRSTGRSLDGVLATDPVALAGLLRATGPVSGTGLKEPLNSSNAADVLLHDTYITFADEPEAQSRFLTSLIRNFYDAFDSKAVDGSELAKALGSGASARHLMMYSRFEDEQAGLQRLGATGELGGTRDPVQHVFHNNLGDNKVDFYLQRSVDTRIVVTRGGDALVRTRITVENDAPATGQDPMTKSYTGAARPGTNLMDLRVLMPETARNPQWESQRGGRLKSDSGVEAGLPSTSIRLKVPAQDRRVVTLEYELPEATQLLRGGNLSLTLIPHPTARPDLYSVEVVPPVGFRVETDLDAGSRERGSTRFSGSLDKSVEIKVRFEPTG